MKKGLFSFKKLLYILLLIFPFGFLLFVHLLEFVRILINGNPSDYIQWLPFMGDGRLFFIFVLLLIILFFALVLHPGYVSRFVFRLVSLSDSFHILFLIVLAVMLRACFFSVINTQPVSDFDLINKDAQALAMGSSPSRMYVATHVAITMIYGFLYRLFGVDLLVPKIFNAILYAFSGVLFYLSVKSIFASKGWGVAGGILLVSWPSLVAYSSVMTPEHMFVFLLCLLFFVLASCFPVVRLTNTIQPHLSFFVAIGVVTGVMNMFRPFGVLFILSFVIVIIFSVKERKKSVLNLLICIAIYWLLGRVPTMVADHYSNSFVNLRPCNLLVGVNVDFFGQFNEADVLLCKEIRDTSSGNIDFIKEILEISLDRLYQEQDQLIKFFVVKFSILWSNSNGILYWAFQPPLETLRNQEILIFLQRLNMLDFSLMLVGSILTFLGLLVSKKNSPFVIFNILVFSGFNLMEVPFEMQTRYRTIVMPVFILLSCWGALSLVSFFSVVGKSLQSDNVGSSLNL